MNILLIDDHPLFREGLALLLQPLAEGLSIWQAGSVEQGLALAEERGAPDLLLIDLAMPGTHGITGIALWRQRWNSATTIVAVSSSDDRETVLRSVDAGAMGFIPKGATPAVLISALRLVLARGVYLPPHAFVATTPGLPIDPVQPPTVVGAPPRRVPADLGLTPRQADVLYLLLQGKPAKLIERELNISAGTAKTHTSAVLRALNVSTRTQAVIAAGRLGLHFGAMPMDAPSAR